MSSLKNWDLEVDPDIYKFLKRQPRRDAEVILDIIRLLPADPYFGDIQKMKGTTNIWRRRIGNYRIYYKVDIKERVILVFMLERRTSKTYRKR